MTERTRERVTALEEIERMRERERGRVRKAIASDF
jgi:hypothetical protein